MLCCITYQLPCLLLRANFQVVGSFYVVISTGLRSTVSPPSLDYDNWWINLPGGIKFDHNVVFVRPKIRTFQEGPSRKTVLKRGPVRGGLYVPRLNLKPFHFTVSKGSHVADGISTKVTHIDIRHVLVRCYFFCWNALQVAVESLKRKCRCRFHFSCCRCRNFR